MLFEKNDKKAILLRAICIALAYLMLTVGLVSCGTVSDSDGEDSSTPDSPDVSDSSSDSQVEGKPTNYVPTAITDDFGSYEFKVLTRGSGQWLSEDIVGDAVGNKLDQAVYMRNEALASKYNFKVVETKDKNWTDTAETLGGSGTATYDMWSFRMNDMPSYGQSGYIYNLNEVDGLNLDAQYYDQSTRAMGSFNNYLFFLTGDLLYLDDMATSVMMFNPKIYDDLKLDELYGKSIYQLASEGKWTFERLEAFCKAATYEVNGDSTMSPEDDMWGFSYQNADILTFNIAFGNKLLEKDSDDIFVLNESTKMINDLQEIMRFFNAGYSAATGDWTKNRFDYGNQLLTAGWVNECSRRTTEGIDFGCVPMPKANDDQESYHSFITTYGSNCITIPRTISGERLEKVANIIELLSYESSQRVTPVMMDYLLGGRVINNAEDAEMLRIAMDTKTYELCYLWSTGSLYSTMISVNEAGGVGIKSALDTSRDAVKASVQRKVDRLNKLG